MKIISKALMTICVLVLLLNTTCDEDDVVVVSDCDLVTIVDNDLYNSINNESSFGITSATLDGDCLALEVTASGCDGNSWEFDLVDSGSIAESSPVQRFLKVKFTNNESCLAVFTRSVTFDISGLQVANENSVTLNIEGLEDPFLYEY